MKNTISKFGRAFAGIAFAFLLVASLSQNVRADEAKPVRGNGIVLGNLDFIGAPTYKVESSTPANTPILLLSGQGQLYGIQASSGAAGDFCLGLDSASTSNLSVNTQGKAVTPQVFSAGQGAGAATACTSAAVCNAYAPRWPKQFANGFVGIKSSNGVNCYYDLRNAQGKNPF